MEPVPGSQPEITPGGLFFDYDNDNDSNLDLLVFPFPGFGGLVIKLYFDNSCSRLNQITRVVVSGLGRAGAVLQGRCTSDRMGARIARCSLAPGI